MPPRWDYETDIAVVGGGACGLMTAVHAAANSTLEVVVFEKNTRLNSNAQISSASLAAGGTRFQREAGVVDSPEHHAADILRKNHGQCDPKIVLAICRAARDYVAWLDEEVGYPLELGTEMIRVGHSVSRIHTDSDRLGGARLVAQLKQLLEKMPNILFVDNTPGRELIEEDGKVLGLTILENGERRTVRAGTTVLASDGFGANPDMVAKYCPEIAGGDYIGVEGNVGDGILAGMAVGADTSHMTGFQGHGLVIPGYRTRLGAALPLYGAIIVGDDGRRFIREDQGYSELALPLMARPNRRALMIWGDNIMPKVINSELMRDSTEAGAYRRFEGLDPLATHYRLPEAELRLTVDAFNDGIRAGSDPLGRQLLGEPLKAPYYAAYITAAMAHTQGGLTVDATGRVQRGGQAIPNLYAGGGTAAGISGDSCDGYLSGNGLLAAMGFGYIIGNHLASGSAF